MEIDKLVKATIETKIIEAFRNAPEAIDALVKGALSLPVNDYGGKPEYNSNKMPYLTWLAGEQIRRIAQTAIVEHFKEIEPGLKEQIKKQLTTESVVEAFAKEILKATADDWRVKVHFGAEK